MINRNFGKLIDENNVQFAPFEIKVNGHYVINPKAESYLIADDGPWYPIVDKKPEQKFGVYFVAVGWKLENNVIYRKYEERQIVEPDPPVVRYSKLKIIVASKKHGLWERLKDLIHQAGYEDEWNACQFIASDYEQFNVAKNAIIQSGIATEDEVDLILSESIDQDLI